MRFAFVTNNAARPAADVAKHLDELGIPASASEVVTSAQAAAGVLAQWLPEGAPVLVVGGDGLYDALRERCLVPATSLDDRPAAVVQGFHPDVSWRLLAEGAYAVAGGLPWVATNTDLTIPTARGIAPGNGALVAAIEAAVGRSPVVAGKPEPPIFQEAITRIGAEHALVVGDRLDTDIAGANRSGLESLLVLTGVTSPADVVVATPNERPTYIGADLRALMLQTAETEVKSGVSAYGGWTASIDEGVLHLRLDGDGSGIDAVRAACGAAWEYGDGIDSGSVADALTQAMSRDKAIP
jgi:HAD superfamily hydrolase (TIGR01450 family)